MKAKNYVFDEFSDSVLYKDLAASEKDQNNKAALIKLAEQEYGHYVFWKKFTPGYEPIVGSFLLKGYCQISCALRFWRGRRGISQ